MRSLTASLALSALVLTACSSSVLTPEEKTVPETSSSYDGSTQIDETQSYVSFVGRSNIINHECKFNEFDVTILPDALAPTDLTKATIEAEIAVASVETDADGLTGHLQKADFFDVENHPTVTFQSTSIVSTGENTYDVTGDLTMKGVTKSVTLDATATNEYLLITGEVPRVDFGIGNDSYGAKLLEPMVEIEAKLVFQK
jgi:polyisoprenoid-binding protein YceI